MTNKIVAILAIIMVIIGIINAAPIPNPSAVIADDSFEYIFLLLSII